MPDQKDTAKLHYSISKDALVTIKIFNRRNLKVRTLLDKASVKSGKQVAEWDGKNDMGKLLPSGAYIYTIQARSGKQVLMYDPADETGGNLLEVRKPLLDTEKGEIAYVMPKAGMVRIRAGIREGAQLITLIDWEPREGGQNVEKWDGRDKSGLINLFNIPNRDAFIFAYSLPDNSIILKRTDKQSDSPSDFISATLPEYRRRDKSSDKDKSKYALEDPLHSREPEFEVIFPKDGPRTSDNVPIVSGVVPVRISIADKDKQRLESARFEVMFFVDTVFLFEDEEGFTPFTYMWKTQGLPEGEHIFTVNIMSYDGHCGVESQKVIVKNDKEKG